MTINDNKMIKDFILECAFDQDDIGNVAIEVSMRYDISVNKFLEILKSLVKEKKVGLNSNENNKIINIDIDELDNAFHYNRYNVFLYIIV